MQDVTENIRRAASEQLNTEVQSNDETAERTRLEALYGKENVFDTKQLGAAFEVLGFMAPFCVVRQKSSGKKGAITFQHSPRFYFDFIPAWTTGSSSSQG